MIVLDTDVISEMMRSAPDDRVTAWLASQPMSALFTTTLTQAEILYGLTLLPEGRRRDDLFAAARPIFDEDMAGRILPFDSDAALIYPDIAAGRRQSGHPISQIDVQIAAIARSRGARLATRNVRDFNDCGIEVVDPWSSR
jgi:predicted nucleic acid-binding protein